MKCLAVNTATSILSLALVEDGETRHLFESAETRDQGNLLVANIQAGLEMCGWGFPDLDLLAVVNGPGSFTGIRIGLATMRGFALATGKPLAGVTSFDLFAVEGEGVNLVAVESWREELYCRCGDLVVNESSETLAARLKDTPPAVISGDAAEKVAPFFPDARIEVSVPNAEKVARLARGMTPGENAVPYYLREADVTVKKTG